MFRNMLKVQIISYQSNLPASSRSIIICQLINLLSGRTLLKLCSYNRAIVIPTPELESSIRPDSDSYFFRSNYSSTSSTQKNKYNLKQLNHNDSNISKQLFIEPIVNLLSPGAQFLASVEKLLDFVDMQVFHQISLISYA